MFENPHNIITLVLFFIFILSVLLVIKIAVNRRLDLKRWIFYGVFFHIFALFYLLYKGGMQKSHGRNSGAGEPNGTINK